MNTTSDFKLFYQFPFMIYRDNPSWVAPFWSEIRRFFKGKNPFWSHADCQLFIARKHKKVVGRIAALIDYSYCKSVGKNIGYFGFFECVEDYACAQALFQVAENWLSSKNMTVIRGPIDGRIDVGCGFLSLGFNERTTVLSTYSPAYYLSYAEHYGFKKARDFFHYSIDLTKPLPTQLEEKARQCHASGIQMRHFNRLRTGRELNWWISFFLVTFSEHWGFVPVSPEEVKTRFGVKNLRWFVDSALFLIAERDGLPVAYLWSTPEYNQLFQQMHGHLGPIEMLQFLLNQHTINAGKLHFIGIKKDARHHHIASFLNYQALLEMKNRGYQHAEVGWIDEQNTIAHATIALTGATVYKKHRVFEKDISIGPVDCKSELNENKTHHQQ